MIQMLSAPADGFKPVFRIPSWEQKSQKPLCFQVQNQGFRKISFFQQRHRKINPADPAWIMRIWADNDRDLKLPAPFQHGTVVFITVQTTVLLDQWTVINLKAPDCWEASMIWWWSETGNLWHRGKLFRGVFMWKILPTPGCSIMISADLIEKLNLFFDNWKSPKIAKKV